MGKYDEAIKLTKKAVLINPCCFQAFNSQGNSLNSKKKYEKALKVFKKVIKISPECYQGWNGYGISFGELGKLE